MLNLCFIEVSVDYFDFQQRQFNMDHLYWVVLLDDPEQKVLWLTKDPPWPRKLFLSWHCSIFMQVHPIQCCATCLKACFLSIDDSWCFLSIDVLQGFKFCKVTSTYLLFASHSNISFNVFAARLPVPARFGYFVTKQNCLQREFCVGGQNIVLCFIFSRGGQVTSVNRAVKTRSWTNQCSHLSIAWNRTWKQFNC